MSGRGRPTRLLDSSFARFAEAARCLLRVGLAAHAQHGSSIRRSTACGPRCCCRASPARRPPSSPRPLRASLPAAAPPPTVCGPRRALFSLPPRDSARSHCVSFSFSFSSRGGGVGFGEGLGEGGVLAPCEEGSGGGVWPLCVGAPGPADAAVLPVQFRQPAALLLHCLCLQAIASSLGLPNEFVLLLPPLWSPFPACLCCLDWVLLLWGALSAVNSYCCLSASAREVSTQLCTNGL
ncbi:hypothetical protein PVAP13_9NG204173 [Panicum virgatum]|uniref:Uncharacterized protein n=1 Tax=Panicum virgatum TaxID=38727 RepID=A0A8T0MN17_PANVG|nr:hypothetical protein PVAP13_9NG204173 [Panicum virgatum]